MAVGLSAAAATAELGFLLDDDDGSAERYRCLLKCLRIRAPTKHRNNCLGCHRGDA
jgi:hypothetical protein